MKVRANTPIKYDGKRYSLNEEIDMREEEVKRLGDLVTVIDEPKKSKSKGKGKEGEK